ncbi:MAG: HD domain-containing phosphohydrolase [bacterium]
MINHNRRILIVDDQPEILEDYIRILSPVSPQEEEEKLASLEAAIFGDIPEQGPGQKRSEKDYTLILAKQGEEAVSLVAQAVNEKKPFAVTFMDVRMPPGINGVQAASEIHKIDPDLEIVLVTAHSDVSRQKILELLGTADKLLYLRKPFDADEIKQLAMALTDKWNLSKMVEQKTEELRLTHSTTILALAELAELKDTATGGHLKRVAEYSKLIATELGKLKEPMWCKYITDKYIQDLGESSVLHDIGKIGIPEAIWLKPDKLTVPEFEFMETHTTIGGDALAKADREMGIPSFLTQGKEVAYYHHEKFDGTGYPKGLKGRDIPLSARIVALADVYDALTSMRPYRQALSHEAAYRLITEEMGKKHFDPLILHIFQKNAQRFKVISQKYSWSL